MNAAPGRSNEEENFGSVHFFFGFILYIYRLCYVLKHLPVRTVCKIVHYIFVLGHARFTTPNTT